MTIMKCFYRKLCIVLSCLCLITCHLCLLSNEGFPFLTVLSCFGQLCSISTQWSFVLFYVCVFAIQLMYFYKIIIKTVHIAKCKSYQVERVVTFFYALVFLSVINCCVVITDVALLCNQRDASSKASHLYTDSSHHQTWEQWEDSLPHMYCIVS